MDNENTKVEIESEAIVHPPEGAINPARSSVVSVKTENAANHTEISIMKSQWELICRKVNDINLGKWNINFKELVIGAGIPIFFEIFSDYNSGQTPDYFPLVVCIALYVIVSFLSSKIPAFRGDSSESNLVHLQDLKGILADINRAKENENDQ